MYLCGQYACFNVFVCVRGRGRIGHRKEQKFRGREEEKGERERERESEKDRMRGGIKGSPLKQSSSHLHSAGAHDQQPCNYIAI